MSERDECPTCWGDGYLDHDLGRETCTTCWGSGITKTVEGVGTGAGEDAPRQDTGSARVTRSEDCPEAPAQAHSLDLTHRTQWTPPGSIGPRWHDFWAREAAEHFAGILRTNGHHHVTTHQLDATEQRENR